MKVKLMFVLLFGYFLSSAQLNIKLGSDIVTYKFKTSDISYHIGFDLLDVSDNGFIKEASLSYSRLYDFNSLVVGVYLGKKIGKFYIRPGVDVYTLSNSNIHACMKMGYSVDKYIILNLNYGYILTQKNVHTIGATALYTLF